MTNQMIFELAPLGLIRITGEKAKPFLQGQLTCNLDDVTSSQSRLGAHCNPQGRIISLFRLFLHKNNYYLQMPRELVPLAIQALQKYAVFFKVTLTDISNEWKQIGYAGEELPDMPQHVNEQQSTDNLVITRLPGSPARYQFIGEAAAIAQLGLPTVLSDFSLWKSMDIRQNLPAIYPATSEKFLPHDIDLPKLDAVSFNKGCYTGQEIIARMHYRGKLKNHLHRASIKTDLHPQIGADIYLDGKSCGNLVDFCQIDYNSYEVLVIAQDADTQDKTLTMDPEKKYSLEFLS